MGLTAANVRRLGMAKGEADPVRTGFVDLTFDSSYPTGGEEIAASDIDSNLKGLLGLVQIGANEAANAMSFRFDSANSKIEAYTAAGEVADTTDLSGSTVTFLWWGY